MRACVRVRVGMGGGVGGGGVGGGGGITNLDAVARQDTVLGADRPELLALLRAFPPNND